MPAAAMPTLRYARLARDQIIRGIHAWIARDYPAEDAIGMTAALLDTDAAEVAAAIEKAPGA